MTHEHDNLITIKISAFKYAKTGGHEESSNPGPEKFLIIEKSALHKSTADIAFMNGEYNSFQKSNMHTLTLVIDTLLRDTWEEILRTKLEPENSQICRDLSQGIIEQSKYRAI